MLKVLERTFDLTSLGFLVQTLRVPLFAFFKTGIHKYFDKGEGRVVLCVQLASKVAISLVRRNERGDSQSCRRSEQQRDLSLENRIYLRNAANVFFTVLRREAKVLVQSEANVIAVQTIG